MIWTKTLKCSCRKKPWKIAVVINNSVYCKWLLWLLISILCSTGKHWLYLVIKGGFRGGPRVLRPPLFFEILYYFYRLLRKIKKVSSRKLACGQVSQPPLSEFSGSASSDNIFVAFSWKPASWINSSCDFLYQPTVIIPLPVWEVIKPYDWPLSCIGTCHNLVIWGQIVYMNIPIRKDSISENKNNLKMKNIII